MAHHGTIFRFALNCAGGVGTPNEPYYSVVPEERLELSSLAAMRFECIVYTIPPLRQE